jgi:DNA-binding MarR family transcriptional regulator
MISRRSAFLTLGRAPINSPADTTGDFEMIKKRSPAQEKTVDPAVSTQPQVPEPFSPLREVMWRRPGYLIRRLTQIGQAIFFDLCKSESITPLQVGMLTALSVNPWLDQKAICRELVLDRTTAAEVLKRLQDKGLVESRVNPDDRRSRLSVITKPGLNLINELQGSIHRSQELLVEPLSPEERAEFMRLLAKLVDAHEKMDKLS